MKYKHRKPLNLETLESRWVPANINFDGTNLVVNNIGIDGGTSTATVIETGANVFQVKDNGHNNGSFTVTGNITILGNVAPDFIAVNVNATGLAGNLAVTTGNADLEFVTVDSTSAGVGTIFGNVTVNLGSGDNSAVLIAANEGMNTNGSTTVRTNSTEFNTVILGNGSKASTFAGPVTIANSGSVLLGTIGDVFADNVTVQDSIVNNASVFTEGAILGNLSVLGGPGATAVEIDGNVLGNVSANLPGTSSLLDLYSGVTVGNLSYQGGNGTNAFGTDATDTVLGNVVLNWGNGANTLFVTGLVVDGNMSVNNGNGGLNATTNAFQGQVYGNLTVNTGNGPNLFTLDGTNGATVGGTWTYSGGNGGNSVTVTNAIANANSITMNVNMGTLPDNVFTIGVSTDTIATAPGTLSGTVKWAAPSLESATNQFNPDGNPFDPASGYLFQNYITLTNVPS